MGKLEKKKISYPEARKETKPHTMIVVPTNLFLHPSSRHPHSVYRFAPNNNNTSYARSTEEENGVVLVKQEQEEPKVQTHRISNVELSTTKSDEGNILEISMDLPGIKQNDVSVVLDKDCTLKINALKRQGRGTNKKIIKKYQRHFSMDKKIFNLGKLSATLLDGVLTISLPKNPVPKTINVKTISMDPPPLKEDKKKGDDSSSTWLKFMLELPGVKLEDLSVQAKGDKLLINATRKSSSSSILKRSYTVSDAYDLEQASAYLMDGILTVVAHKRDITVATEERSIPINATSVIKDTAPKTTSKDTPAVVVDEYVPMKDEDEDGIVVETVTEDHESIAGEQEEDTVVVDNRVEA